MVASDSACCRAELEVLSGYRMREPEDVCVSRVGTDSLSFAGAGTGDVAVVIVDPQGRRDTVEVALEDKGDNTFRCTYRPVMEGPHTVHVAFAGAPITRSPFPVHVAEGKDASPHQSQAQKAYHQTAGLRIDEKCSI